MPKFDAVEEFMDEPLTLPIKGADGTVRDYQIPQPTASEMVNLKIMHQVVSDGISNRASAVGDAEAVAAMSQRTIIDMALGQDTAVAMEKDGVPGPLFDKAITAGLYFRAGDVETARRVWSGKAQTPKTLSAKTGGGAKRTPKASTNGTTTPRKSPKT